ncbi:amidohydrolase family protein [Saccharopolyspora sp. K220]|uniref:amidohydrolase family protein n=1 Tax=Saccharopolyspora soli TaxID=2926618 RepID=UPI001F59AACE|nr:amidohydrolase family protein [Saccharopolyspora soli]MCI2417959.1 amidohydrolase family protein [Saccharopolyspora soli]
MAMEIDRDTGARVRKIALEEHFGHAAAVPHDAAGGIDFDAFEGSEGVPTDLMARIWPSLQDIGESRLNQMDLGGVEFAILSLTQPGVQGIRKRAQAVSVAREINDFLADTIVRKPNRFGGFASVALQDPEHAAEELDRCVNRLGFKGVMVNGFTNISDEIAYLDEPMFTPFWDAVAALDVPVYLHPRPPHERRAYHGHPEMVGAVWGFGAETALHALRLVFSGLFDRYPTATVVLGHLGEMLPYAAWRIQHIYENLYERQGTKFFQRRIQDYLAENFYLTTSGNFSDTALSCARQVVGTDRILFSIDYPYEATAPAVEWIEKTPLTDTERRKIAHDNAVRLFKL